MHPAAALHRQENRSTIMEDFKAIPAILERSSQAVVEAIEPEEQTKPPEQLTLF
jgi:hypothetical protein